MKFMLPLVGGKAAPSARITREGFDIPCVAGVPDAAFLIRTGARVTVDGCLGIVTVSAAREQ